MDSVLSDSAAFKRRRTSSSSSRPAQLNRSNSPDQIISAGKGKGKGRIAGFDEDEEEEREERVEGVRGEEEKEEALGDHCAICLSPVVNRVRSRVPAHTRRMTDQSSRRLDVDFTLSTFNFLFRLHSVRSSLAPICLSRIADMLFYSPWTEQSRRVRRLNAL